MDVRRGWRWFRRRPPVVQAGVCAVLVAVYSLGLVALVGGGDDPSPRAEQKPRALSPLERRIATKIARTKVQALEKTDVAGFRKPRQPAVRCKGESCDITYSIGLPGRGKILQDMRPIWQFIFAETPVQRAKITVVRNQQAAGVPPKDEEETVAGTPLLTADCDRSRRPDTNWKTESGVAILGSVCEVTYMEGAQQRRQEPIAPDDPAAAGLEGEEG